MKHRSDTVQHFDRDVQPIKMFYFTRMGCIFQLRNISTVSKDKCLQKILNCKKGLLHNSMFIALLIAQFSILSEYQVPGGDRFDEIARNADKLNSFSPVVFPTRYNAINMPKYKALIPYHRYSRNTQRCKSHDPRLVSPLLVNTQSAMRDATLWRCKCYSFIWLVKSWWVLILHPKQLRKYNNLSHRWHKNDKIILTKLILSRNN